MKKFLLTLLVFAFHAPLGFLNAFSAKPALFLANAAGAETTNENSRSYKNDAAISVRHLLYKLGSDGEHVAVCGAADEPVGTIPDEAADAETDLEVAMIGIDNKSRTMVSAEAIDAGEPVYTAAAGKVQDEPVAAGTVWLVGRALTAASGADVRIEVQHCKPVRVVVIVALTAPVTADGSDAGTTQTLANACKADLAALDTACAAPALLKILAP